MKIANLSTRTFLVVVSILILSTVCASASNAPLPKKGDIAVIAESDDDHHAKLAEAAIIDALVKNGYRVVDEGRMQKMRQDAVNAKAAQLALVGNTEGILRLNANYRAAATIIANVKAGEAVENEFKLFTTNASTSLVVVMSRGSKSGTSTATSKQVGYTADEAKYKAIEMSINAAIMDILQKGNQ